MTPREYAEQLTATAGGYPHDDETTTGISAVIAEAVRFLNYATRQGGVTEPATIYSVTGELETAAHRLPQVLGQLGGWLLAEAEADRIADTAHRPAPRLAAETREVLAEASAHAGRLGVALATVHELTRGLYTPDGGER